MVWLSDVLPDKASQGSYSPDVLLLSDKTGQGSYSPDVLLLSDNASEDWGS